MSWYLQPGGKVRTSRVNAPSVAGCQITPTVRWHFLSLSSSIGATSSTKPAPNLTYGVLFTYRQYLGLSNLTSFNVYKVYTTPPSHFKPYIASFIGRVYKYNGSTFTLLKTFTIPHPAELTGKSFTVTTSFTLAKYTLALTTRIYMDFLIQGHNNTSGFYTSLKYTIQKPLQLGTQITAIQTALPISPQLFFVRGTKQ